MRAYVVVAFVLALLNATVPAFAAPAVEQAGNPGESDGISGAGSLAMVGGEYEQPAEPIALSGVTGESSSTSNSASSTETITGTAASITTDATSSRAISIAIIKRQAEFSATIATAMTFSSLSLSSIVQQSTSASLLR